MAESTGIKSDKEWLAMNEAVIAEYRANDGVCGGRWEGNPMVLLTTTGAKSGQQRVSPLTYTTDEKDNIVLIASRAGDSRHPGWYYNLDANPQVVIELGAERFEATARTAEEPERTRLFEERIALMPRFGEYLNKTDRIIPVVVIERN